MADQHTAIEFSMQGDADDTPTSITIRISDDDIKAVGYLIETTNLKKKGWEDTYLATLYLTGSETSAAERAGVSTGQVRRRLANDAVFAELHAQARDRTLTKLLDVTLHDAIYGTPESYTRKDGTVVERRVYDNRLRIDLLDRLHPELKHLSRGDQRLALEGGITVNFQIGERTGPPELPTADVETDAVDLTAEATAEEPAEN